MLRRLRVQILGMATAADRLHVMQLASAAIKLADVQHKFECADILREISGMLMQTDMSDATARGLLDTRLIEALNLAASR